MNKKSGVALGILTSWFLYNHTSPPSVDKNVVLPSSPKAEIKSLEKPTASNMQKSFAESMIESMEEKLGLPQGENLEKEEPPKLGGKALYDIEGIRFPDLLDSLSENELESFLENSAAWLANNSNCTEDLCYTKKTNLNLSRILNFSLSIARVKGVTNSDFNEQLLRDLNKMAPSNQEASLQLLKDSMAPEALLENLNASRGSIDAVALDRLVTDLARETQSLNEWENAKRLQDLLVHQALETNNLRSANILLKSMRYSPLFKEDTARVNKAFCKLHKASTALEDKRELESSLYIGYRFSGAPISNYPEC